MPPHVSPSTSTHTSTNPFPSKNHKQGHVHHTSLHEGRCRMVVVVAAVMMVAVLDQNVVTNATWRSCSPTILYSPTSSIRNEPIFHVAPEVASSGFRLHRENRPKSRRTPPSRGLSRNISNVGGEVGAGGLGRGS